MAYESREGVDLERMTVIELQRLIEDAEYEIELRQQLPDQLYIGEGGDE